MSEQNWEPLEESPEVAAAVRDDTTVPGLASDEAGDESPPFVAPDDEESPEN